MTDKTIDCHHPRRWQRFRQIVQKSDQRPAIQGVFTKLDIYAAIAAYDAVKSKFEGKDIIPIRPVAKRDDLIPICRADLALEYTKTFIEERKSDQKQT